jgi:hypothetical protein
MKMTIAWHKEMLGNRERYLAAEETRLAEHVLQVERQKRMTQFLRWQIEEAEKEGRDGFDEDRYMVKRTAK